MPHFQCNRIVYLKRERKIVQKIFIYWSKRLMSCWEYYVFVNNISIFFVVYYGKISEQLNVTYCVLLRRVCFCYFQVWFIQQFRLVGCWNNVKDTHKCVG